MLPSVGLPMTALSLTFMVIGHLTLVILMLMALLIKVAVTFTSAKALVITLSPLMTVAKPTPLLRTAAVVVAVAAPAAM